MQDTVLIAALKYGFLALLALFVFFTVRTIAITLRVPAPRRSEGPSRASRPAATKKTATGSAKTPNVVIVRTAGKKVGTFKLKEGLTLGRDEGCAISPADDYLSQIHARFSRRDDAWFVEDLGSTNGTFLNDQKLSGPMELRAGDVVRAGTTRMELRR